MARPRLEPGEWGEVSTGGKTANGKIRARTRYCTSSGRLVTIEATGDSEAKAKRRLKKKMENWLPDEARTLFRDVGKQWIASLEAEDKLRPQTIEGYRRILKTTLEPHIGSRTVGGITPGLLTGMFDEIFTSSPGNYGGAMTVAAGVFSFAAQRDIISSTPMASITRRVTASKEVRALTLEELAELRGNIRLWQAGPRRTQPILDIVDLALSTAARISELLSAKWEDVDFQARTLRLWTTQVWVKGRGILDQDGTKEDVVLVLPLTNFAMVMLEERRAADPTGTYIFATRKGTMIARSNLGRAWRAARGPGMEWVAWHTFRKSVATLAAEATDSQTAAKLLGHTTDKVTRKHYIVATKESVPDLTAVLEALAGEKAPVNEDDDDDEL